MIENFTRKFKIKNISAVIDEDRSPLAFNLVSMLQFIKEETWIAMNEEGSNNITKTLYFSRMYEMVTHCYGAFPFKISEHKYKGRKTMGDLRMYKNTDVNDIEFLVPVDKRIEKIHKDNIKEIFQDETVNEFLETLRRLRNSFSHYPIYDEEEQKRYLHKKHRWEEFSSKENDIDTILNHTWMTEFENCFQEVDYGIINKLRMFIADSIALLMTQLHINAKKEINVDEVIIWMEKEHGRTSKKTS